MELARELLSAALLCVGAAFALVGGIGILRLPDVFTRMHGSGITDTLGAGAILAGLVVRSGLDLVSVKLLAVAFFLLITSPTATHALARAALAEGVRPQTVDGEDASSSG